MNRKSLKQVAVVLTVVSFFMMTSVSAFAQSANRSNNFNILGNVPEQEARQLSDEEMGEVEGAFICGGPCEIIAILLGVGALAFEVYSYYYPNNNSSSDPTIRPFAPQLYTDMQHAGIDSSNLSVTEYNYIYDNKITNMNQIEMVVNSNW